MSARILVADPNEQDRDVICARVRAAGYEVVSAADAQTAAKTLETAEFSLIISELNLPGWGVFGDNFRDYVRSRDHLREIPFIFVTSADEEQDWELAQRLDDEVVLLKPLTDFPELNRIVSAQLGHVRRVADDMTPDTFADILGRIEKGKGTGVLTVYRGETTKRMFFREGLLAFSTSNDSAELIGQAFLRAGIVCEDDITWAYAMREEGTVPVGQLLLSVGDTTPEEMGRATQRKLVETVLDIFTWKSAHYVYFSGGIDPKELPFWAQQPLAPLIEEGKRRAAAWTQIEKHLPPIDMRFNVVGDAIPTNTPGLAAMARLVTNKHSIAEIALEVRGQRLARDATLMSWLAGGFIEPSEARGPVWEPADRKAPICSELEVGVIESLVDVLAQRAIPDFASGADVADEELVHILERGLITLSTGSLDPARVAFREVLDRDPTNVLARRKLAEIADRQIGTAWAAGVYPERQAKLTGDGKGLDTLVDCTPTQTFLVRRLISGPRLIADLEFIAPFSRAELLGGLQFLANAGVVEITKPDAFE